MSIAAPHGLGTATAVTAVTMGVELDPRSAVSGGEPSRSVFLPLLPLSSSVARDRPDQHHHNNDDDQSFPGGGDPDVCDKGAYNFYRAAARPYRGAGRSCPADVQLYSLPSTVGVPYTYSVIGGQTVVLNPGNREIVGSFRK
jgi:hypothetical protein